MSKLKYSIILSACIAGLIMAPSAKAYNCSPVKVAWPGVFGNGIDINGPQNALPKYSKRDKNFSCQIRPNGKIVDCRFRDSKGIYYGIFDGVITQMEVSASSIQKYGLRIVNIKPFPLSIKDFSKIQQAVPTKFNIFKKDNGETVASTGLCLLNNEDWFELYLEYDSVGMLKTVGVRTDNPD